MSASRSAEEFAAAIDAVTVGELRRRGSLKWSRPGPDGYGAWVAEMDFGAAPPVLEALAALSADRQFGYLPDAMATELGEACAAWQADRYGWAVDPADVHPLPDVLKGLEVAITDLSPAGSPVILPTPAYMPFLLLPPLLGREILQVPMPRDADGRAVLDLDGLDRAFRAGGHLLILCNPYNPLGRVFTDEELAAVTEVVDRHGGRVFADEIHAPLVYPGHRHRPYAATSDTAAGHTITAVSASKAWNLPGLKCAQVVLSNDADRDRWVDLGFWAGHGTSNPGVVANTAAYRSGGPWLDDVLTYLDGNRRLLADLLADRLPDIRYRPPEGTYLAWLDAMAYDLPDSPGALLTAAGVHVVDGPEFGEGGPGSFRLNFATPRPVLGRLVDRTAETLLSARR